MTSVSLIIRRKKIWICFALWKCWPLEKKNWIRICLKCERCTVGVRLCSFTAHQWIPSDDQGGEWGAAWHTAAFQLWLMSCLSFFFSRWQQHSWMTGYKTAKFGHKFNILTLSALKSVVKIHNKSILWPNHTWHLQSWVLLKRYASWFINLARVFFLFSSTATPPLTVTCRHDKLFIFVM